MRSIAVARKRFPIINGGAPRPTVADAKFWDEIIQQLAVCAGFRNPQFDPQHVDALIHWLQHFERRPWQQVATDLWWQWLQQARTNKVTCDRMIALLRQTRGRDCQVALVVVGEILLGLEADIFWLESSFGHSSKPRRGWAVMARMIGALTLTALRGADQLAGRQPRRGFGNATGPIIKFVHRRLVRIAAQNPGEKLPGLETLFKTLTNKPRRGVL